jgi:pimeloyl-ACP methyl ester carboxylesterase
LPYDATVMGDYSLPEERARAVSVPTLVIVGGASFGIFAPSADALASLLPHGERHTIPDQGHDVDPSLLAPVVAEFLKR